VTVEVDLTVKNPCENIAQRKFLEVYNATDIKFPVGSKFDYVNVTWTEDLDFDEMANMTNPCLDYEIEIKHPSSLVLTNLEENEPKKGIILSLPTLEESQSYPDIVYDEPQLLKVEAFYSKYLETSREDKIR